jgi:hypothetical protein
VTQFREFKIVPREHHSAKRASFDTMLSFYPEIFAQDLPASIPRIAEAGRGVAGNSGTASVQPRLGRSNREARQWFLN